MNNLPSLINNYQSAHTELMSNLLYFTNSVEQKLKYHPDYHSVDTNNVWDSKVMYLHRAETIDNIETIDGVTIIEFSHTDPMGDTTTTEVFIRDTWIGMSYEDIADDIIKLSRRECVDNAIMEIAILKRNIAFYERELSALIDTGDVS